MINSYDFGTMVIDGQQYQKDVIILPDMPVISPWWRQSGHQLVQADIEAILNASPEILIIGTGSPGLMKPDPALLDLLDKKGIDTIVQPTKQAVKTYNSMSRDGENVAACFHLTC